MSAIAIVVVVVLVLVAVLWPVVKELLIDEVRAWLPHIARALVRSAARGLPAEHRVRYEEEWLGEIDAYADRPLTALARACGVRCGARALRRTVSGPPEALATLSNMPDPTRELIAQAIADDERWIVQARALIKPDADCSSIEESIARAEDTVWRMRAHLDKLT